MTIDAEFILDLISYFMVLAIFSYLFYVLYFMNDGDDDDSG